MSSKGIYYVGIIGFIMLIVSTVLMQDWSMHYVGYIIPLVMFTISVVLGSFTFFGFSKDHGSKLCQVVFIVSLIFPWLLLSSVILEVFLGLYLFGETLFILGQVFHGVTFLLWGSAMLIVRKEFSQPELYLVSGIFFMLASITYFSIFPFSSLYLIVAGTVGVIALYTSEGFK